MHTHAHNTVLTHGCILYTRMHTRTDTNTHNLTMTWLMAPRLSQAEVLFGCRSAICMNTYREGKRGEKGREDKYM